MNNMILRYGAPLLNPSTDSQLQKAPKQIDDTKNYAKSIRKTEIETKTFIKIVALLTKMVTEAPYSVNDAEQILDELLSK